MSDESKLSTEELERYQEIHNQFQKMLDEYSRSIPDWQDQSPSMIFLHLQNSVDELREWMARYPSESLRKSWREQQKKKWDMLQVLRRGRGEEGGQPPDAASEVIGLLYGVIASGLALLGVLLKTNSMDVIVKTVLPVDKGDDYAEKIKQLSAVGIARRYLAIRTYCRQAEELAMRADDVGITTITTDELFDIYMIPVLGMGISSTIAIVEGLMTDEEAKQIDMSAVVV